MNNFYTPEKFIGHEKMSYLTPIFMLRKTWWKGKLKSTDICFNVLII